MVVGGGLVGEFWKWRWVDKRENEQEGLVMVEKYLICSDEMMYTVLQCISL